MTASPRSAMVVPGLNSSLGDRSTYNNNKRHIPTAINNLAVNKDTKFADSRSLSWEYSPTNKSLLVPSTMKPNNMDKAPRGGCTVLEGPMDIDMETDDGGGRVHSDSHGVLWDDKAGINAGQTSPDVIPSPPTPQHHHHNSTLVDTSVFGYSPTPISKSASLTSLQPGVTAYFRTASPPTKAGGDARPFRRSTSSQSLSNLQTGSASLSRDQLARSKDPQFLNNRKSGATPSPRRSPTKILSGTLEAISNMIISKSGVSPKMGSGSLARQSPSSPRLVGVPIPDGRSLSTSRSASVSGSMEFAGRPSSSPRSHSMHGATELATKSPLSSSRQGITIPGNPDFAGRPTMSSPRTLNSSIARGSPHFSRAHTMPGGPDLVGTSPPSLSPELSVTNVRATPEARRTSSKLSKTNSPNSRTSLSPSGKPSGIDHSKPARPNSHSPKATTNMTSGSPQTDVPQADVTTKAEGKVPSTPVPAKKAAALTKSNVMTSQVDSVMLVSLAGSGGVMSPAASLLVAAGAKDYIMDKYFEEIAKSWDQPDTNSSDGPPDVTACGREFSADAHQGAAAAVAVRPMMCSCGVARSEHPAHQGEDSVSLQDHTAPCPQHAKSDIRNSYNSSNLRMYTQVHDLIHLEEPLTEEAVIKTLQARFYTGHYSTHIGPLLVLVNPLTFSPLPNPIGESSTTPANSHLQRMLQDATRQQMETGLPQTLLLNGVSGSGKTHASMVLLRGLFDVVGGGAETDAFKHLQAALTVLRALGSAATCQNPHSSRMGYMIENDIADGAIYRTKIHCYFIDQIRVVKPQQNEKNFHIFYQMLAGLSMEDRAKYHLTGHSSHTLNFLSSGDVTQDDTHDREHFISWKNALSVLGIPFADIMRALSAVLLLGNLEFVEGPGLELQVEGEPELQSVAALLGVTTASLYRGLTSRTRRARGQIFKALVDPQTANHARDALAKALYCRLVAAIIKRANNTKRLVVNCANSTDSGDSGNNDGSHQEGLLSRSCISRGSGQGVMTSQMESFIGVLDMFGFEKLQTNHFEQLSVNLCSETLQHFYNTHMFRAAEEACAEEAITADIDVTYADNAPTIELLSSPRVGVLSLLDAECGLQRGCPETLLQKVHIQHSRNKRFFEPANQNSHSFGIRHFCGDVTYDAKDLLTSNRNQLPDDIISTFTKQNCSFGFASHLFSQEIKAIQEDGGGPKGAVYRISPSPVIEKNGDMKGSLSSDFHSKLDGILQLLVASRPHFIRCIKSNVNHQRELFEREVVKQQLRALQLLETLHLMAAGFPHRLRYRMFNNRYHVLLTEKGGRSDKNYEESKLILDKLLKAVDESDILSSNAHWALGKKHIFLSEGCRQLLEELRNRRRNQAATVVQSRWRRRMCLKKWPTLKRQLLLRKRDRQPIRKHIRRNSLLEGAALQKLEDEQRLQQASNSYRGNVVYVTGSNPRLNTDQRGSQYGSHDYLYGQAGPNGQPHNRTQDTNGHPAYNGSSTGHNLQGEPVYSQGGLNGNRGTQPPTNGHRRQGSHDFADRGVSHQPLGPGRYSFHGDTRQGRPTTADVCNQRPRSRSSERHYISHVEFQKQHNPPRQRSYSSHTEFRDSLPRHTQPPHSYQPPTQQPPTQQPPTQQPHAQQPHSYQPPTQQPPTQQPPTQQPHAQQPHAQQPHNQQPHNQQPHNQQPHNQQPHTQQIHSQQPHTQQIHSQQPHTQQPHNQQPHTQQPHTQQPHNPQTHTQQLHSQQTHTQQPHNQQTHNQQTHSQQTHRQQPHTQQPHTQQPHTQQPHSQQPQTQRYLHNGQGSRFSHSSYTSSGSGSNMPPQQNSHSAHPQDASSRSNQNPAGVYNGQIRTNGVSSSNAGGDRNSYNGRDNPQVGRPHQGSHQVNGTENSTKNDQYTKDNTVKSARMVNGHDPPSKPTSHPEPNGKAPSEPHVAINKAEAPPVPASRTYTVRGNMKLGYPQIRIMRENYQESPSTPKLPKGHEIKVVGSSSKRGYLLVEQGNEIIQVPFHLTDLKTMPLTRTGIDV